MEKIDARYLASHHDWVVSSLEHDQLANAKKHPIPQRQFSGLELFVVWGLRVYVLFMMTVVVYQVWTVAR